MRVISLLFTLLLSAGLLAGCAVTAKDMVLGESATLSAAPQEMETPPPDTQAPSEKDRSDDMPGIIVTVGAETFEAQLLDNESARALVEQLPLTLEMSDHAGQEKVIALPFELPPAQTEKPDTIHTGELYLWSADRLVLFYETFANSYDGYVRLGAIEDADGLADALGSGDVTVTLGASIASETIHPAEGNILAAYFSCTGNTEQIANLIAEHTEADLFPITPEVPYTPEDLDYGDPSSRSTIEQNDPDARPAVSGVVEEMEQYDTIFLGYPIWFGQAPKIISTFLESYDFGGKTIVPFCTSGSSGIGSSDTNLHNLVADSAKWIQGERLASDTTSESIYEWISNLDITAILSYHV